MFIDQQGFQNSEQFLSEIYCKENGNKADMQERQNSQNSREQVEPMDFYNDDGWKCPDLKAILSIFVFRRRLLYVPRNSVRLGDLK